MTDTVISFFDCSPAVTGTALTVSASEGSSLYRIDRDRLREAVDLFFSVGSRAGRAVRRAAEKTVRKTVRAVLPAGRRLIDLICNFRF